MSTTLDQVVAQHIGQDTTLPSLELAAETTQQAAACSGSACFYNTTLSFRDAHSPLPMEYNPRKVFTQLFGEGDTPEERAAIARSDEKPARSHHRPHPRAAAGPGCQAIAPCSTTTWKPCARSNVAYSWPSSRDLSAIEVPEAPIGELDAFDKQVDLIFDLIALAYRPTSRVSRRTSWSPKGRTAPTTTSACRTPSIRSRTTPTTWTGSRSWSRSRPGISSASPRSSRNCPRSRTATARCWITRCSCTARTCPTATGTTATRCRRSSWAARNGKHRGGQHVDPGQPTPLANLHLTILDKVGIERKSFGDSTGLIGI